MSHVVGPSRIGETARPLLGREEEAARAQAALAGAGRSKGSTLLVRGEAGIGKTATLENVAGALEPELRVVWVRGVEAEAEIGYAGLAGALRPLLGALDALPPTQRAALESALALGPAAPSDPLAVGSATLSLLVAGAEERPLAVIVDDVQFLDAPSQRALAFAARRLSGERFGMLVAIRDGHATAFDTLGLEEMRLEPLPRGAAADLVVTCVPGIAASARDQIVETASGVPLALVELPTLLDEDQLAGRRPLDDPLRVNGTVSAAFAHRLALLSEDARRLLLLVAADDTADLAVIERAGLQLGIPTGALDESERLGVLVLGPPLRFSHPLLRSLVYHSANPADQRLAHAALADSVRDDDLYRRAWHRGMAASGPAETVALQLDEAAATARARNLLTSAAAAAERAAALSEGDQGRARRLLAAASDHQLSGSGEQAAARIAEALELTAAPDVRAEAVRLQALALVFAGHPREAFALLTAEAETIAETYPDAATGLLLQATLACQVTGEITTAVATGRRAVEIAEHAGPRTRLAADLGLAEVLILTGDSSAVKRLQTRARSVAALDDPFLVGQLLQSEAMYLLAIGEHEEARALMTEFIARARSAGLPTLLPYPLAGAAEIGYRTGDWPQALANASEAVELAAQTGQVMWQTFALQILARLEAARGNDAAAAEHLEHAEGWAARLGLDAARFYMPAVRSFAALTQGRYEEAVSAGREVEAISSERGLGEPSIVLWAPDLIEALIRLGQTDDARQVLLQFEQLAQATGRVWAHATAARCRGLLEEDYEERLAEALRWHDQILMPFERARTELVLGERRRRDGRRVDAREPIARALTTFKRLGATPWAERAAAELRAAGGRTAGETLNATGELTAHEVRVALILARGATNREAAAELFVSPKTVDYHLQRIYRKLGISSRAKLAQLFPNEPEPSREMPPAAGSAEQKD